MSDLLSFNPRRLTLADLKRARAGPLDGRNPMELFSDPLERAQLVAWCLRTRHDPEFTWADAEQAITLGDFEEFADDDAEAEGEPPPDPPVASPGEPSARPPSSELPSSKPRPRKPTPSDDSVSSSASAEPSTTP